MSKEILLDKNIQKVEFPVELYRSKDYIVELTQRVYDRCDPFHQIYYNTIKKKSKLNSIPKLNSLAIFLSITITFVFENLDDLKCHIDEDIINMESNSKPIMNYFFKSVEIFNSFCTNMIYESNAYFSLHKIIPDHEFSINLENYFSHIQYRDRIHKEIQIIEADSEKEKEWPEYYLAIDQLKKSFDPVNKSDIVFEYIGLSVNHYSTNNYRSAIIELDIAIDVFTKDYIKFKLFNLNKAGLVTFAESMLNELSVGDSIKFITILENKDEFKSFAHIHNARNQIIHRKKRNISKDDKVQYKKALSLLLKLSRKK